MSDLGVRIRYHAERAESVSPLLLVSGLGIRVSGLGFRDSGFGFRDSGFGIRDSGFGFRVSSFGFRVSGFGIGVYLQLPPHHAGPFREL